MKHRPFCTKGKKEYFEEYCNNTSLHGLKYVGGERRTNIEKIVWSVFFLSAVVICTYMIIQTYKKWENSPVIVSFAHNPTPVGAIPFPAVTICPQNKAKQSLYNFTDLHIKYIFKNITNDERDIYNRLKIVCDLLRGNINHYDKQLESVDYDLNRDVAEEFLKTNMEDEKAKVMEKDDLISFLIKAAPNRHEIFKSCTWNTKRLKCSDLFNPTLNEDGICFTFNMLGDKDLFTDDVHKYKDFQENVTSPVPKTNWNTEDGYEKNAKEFYPRKVIGAGVKFGLELELKADEFDFDYICKTTIQGFKVILHEPGDIAKGKTQYIRVPVDQEVTVAVQPNMLTTSSNLRNYLPSKRNCYFKDERNLVFFRRYTQENCEMECLAQLTLKKCKCAAFYMPRTHKTRLCGPKRQKCIENVENHFLELGVREGGEELPCNCMPACHSLQYQAETSQADYEWKKFQRSMDEIKLMEILDRVDLNNTKNFGLSFVDMNYVKGKADEMRNDSILSEDQRHYSKLNIFFKEKQFISTERSELYGYTDFISNCGGIFGLFTGFSILSLIEIFYYLSLRIWANKKLFGKFCVKTPDEITAIKVN